MEVLTMRHSRIRGLAAVILPLLITLPAHAADKPTDPQIAHIAYTAGDLDIKAAQLALQKSKNDSVRAFANDMVRDHKAVNDQALALVKKLNVTPEDNDTSKGLVKQGRREACRVSESFWPCVRQGLRRQRGRLPPDRQSGPQRDAHSLGQQLRTKKSSRNRSEDFSGSRATRRALGKYDPLAEWIDALS
jgi:hypothetical protein